VTPRSWEHWIRHYEARGYRVLAPAYPGYEGWQHFRQGRAAIDRELAGAPEDIRGRVPWLPIGVDMKVAA
jgi:hypothetical protein